ncbi:MAG: universal stress protein [Pseudomonadota bacterium]
MFHKILLPIDLDHPESWEKALPIARGVSAPGAELHILGIVHDLGAAMIASFLPDGAEQKAMEKLKAGLVDFANANLADVATSEVHVAHGHVPEAILRTADTLGADVIVIASHPPDDLTTRLVGSNADKVVRHATRPVLVVR